MTNSIKFRHHRGSLSDSMDTVVQVASLQELADILKVEVDTISIKPYGYDKRIDWDTHLVCVNGDAVGFTDGYFTYDH